MTIVEKPPADTDAPAEFRVPSPRELTLSRARNHLGLIVGGTLVSAVVLIAAFAPWLAPYDPYVQNVDKVLIQPAWHESGSWAHPLGTDSLGRDYLSRLIYGARISIIIGFFSAAVSAVAGSAVGIVGGYYGGRIDAFVMYLINVKLALPGLLVALALISAFGGSVTVLVLTLAFLFWERYAVVTRTITQRIRASDYIAAAQAVGASDVRIILQEVLPNIFNSIIVVFSLEVAVAIVVEATLSFLGLGVQPPSPSWGLMIAEAKNYMFFQPSLILLPGFAIFVLSIAVNLTGDGLRDVTARDAR